MKTTFTLPLIAIFLTVSSIACTQSRYATDKFDVTDFTAIESSVVANIFIRQTQTTNVTAEGSEDLLDKLNVKMDGETLILDMDEEALKKFNKNANKLTISISTPTLTRLDFNGVGNIEIDGTFTTPELTIDSEGVGNLKAENLHTGYVKVNSEGVGNITLGGNANNVDISSEGVGNVEAKKLKAKNAVVSSEGVGNVNCHAIESLKVNSEGIGNVTYYGNPKETDLSKEGIGKIKAGK